LKDSNGMSVEEFLRAVEESLGKVTEYQEGVCRPAQMHTVGLYVAGKWYNVEFKADICNAEKASERLDCSILQRKFLAPVMGIEDPRTDKRIDFVGGIRGLKYLETLCENGGAAIAMYPTSLDELMAVADAGEIMPPKSTWFEPKLRSGLIIHELS
jgi:uncharacterized protein (DUF1015 family)